MLAGGVFEGGESGAATQLCLSVEGTPRVVSVYFIVREKKEGETPETRCKERDQGKEEKRHILKRLL